MFKKILFLFICSLGVLENVESKQYRILSFDGGGIRGVFSIKVLSMLEEEFHFLKNVDFFSGTSTGGIIAMGLSYGLTPDEILNFYKENGSSIFRPYTTFDPLSLWPRYHNQSLKETLLKIFPADLTMDKIRKKILCVSFDLYNESQGTWAPVSLDNFEKTAARNTLVVDAILRSTAAPIYFASYQNCIDGGVVANNPSMVAVARALDNFGGKQLLSNIVLLSIGTGRNQSYIEDDIDWGIMPWMVYHRHQSPPTPQHPLLDILFDANSEMTDYQCSQLLNDRYRRINTILPQNVDIDDLNQIDFLIEEAKRLPESDPQKWQELKDWIQDHFCN